MAFIIISIIKEGLVKRLYFDAMWHTSVVEFSRLDALYDKINRILPKEPSE